MSDNRKPEQIDVNDAVQQARQRLNRSRLLQCLLGATLACGCIAVIIAISFTVVGHRVPWQLYPITILVTLITSAIAFWRVRYTDESAALYLDDTFNLSDAVTAHRTFERDGKSDGFFAAQHHWTQTHLRNIDFSKIRLVIPPKGMAITALVLLIFFGLAFVPPSAEVLARQERAIQTSQLSEQMKEDLKEHVEEMLKQTPDDEQELLKPNELREWVEKLSETRDLEDMLRQYAELERKVAEASAKLDQRDTEQLLNEAAKQLDQNAETSQLAEKLKQKQYREASKDLDKLKADAKAKIEEHRKNMSRLRKAASQMAEAAQRTSNSNSKMAQQLASDMKELNKRVSEYDKKLSECEACQSKNGQCDSDKLSKMASACNSAGQKLGDMQKQLSKLAAMRSARKQLDQLRQMLAQCQSSAAGQCQSPFAGGQKAGMGASDAKSNEQTPEAKGQTASLQGTKGQGPSQVTVEEADSGTNVSSGKEHKRTLQFEKQYESFVNREDVPDAVKGGVKHYFENIHPEGDPAP